MSKPFKGLFYYEWQIGPFVFQVRHTSWYTVNGASYTLRIPRVTIWRDRFWRTA